MSRTTKRIKSICAVCHEAFEIGDNDKVFFDCGDITRTVCLPCQKKIKKTINKNPIRKEIIERLNQLKAVQYYLIVLDEPNKEAHKKKIKAIDNIINIIQ